jgi:hypothetical protein
VAEVPDGAPGSERDEIAEKAVWWTSATVDALLRRTFSADDVYAASVALTALAPDSDCPPEADETACRLMLAAIRASEGDLAKLALWIDAGRLDPRDLIAAAEYRRELTGGGEADRRADLDEYLAWASRGRA